MSVSSARARRRDEEHPLLAAMARAPVGEPFAPEQLAQLDAQMEAIRDGRVILVPHDDRANWLDAHMADFEDSDE